MRRFPMTGRSSLYIKVGYDLAPRAREFLHTLRKLAPDGQAIEVPHPNNRVNLYYQSAERRCEKLTGGVPPWNWLGLKPLLVQSGCASHQPHQRFRAGPGSRAAHPRPLQGPDLLRHALACSRRPARWDAHASAAAQCGCLVPVLRHRTGERRRDVDDGARFSRACRDGDGLRVSSVLNVTLGSRGAVYFASQGFERLSDLDRHRLAPPTGPLRTELIPLLRRRGISTAAILQGAEMCGEQHISHACLLETISDRR